MIPLRRSLSIPFSVTADAVIHVGALISVAVTTKVITADRSTSRNTIVHDCGVGKTIFVATKAEEWITRLTMCQHGCWVRWVAGDLNEHYLNWRTRLCDDAIVGAEFEDDGLMENMAALHENVTIFSLSLFWILSKNLLYPAISGA